MNQKGGSERGPFLFPSWMCCVSREFHQLLEEYKNKKGHEKISTRGRDRSKCVQKGFHIIEIRIDVIVQRVHVGLFLAERHQASQISSIEKNDEGMNYESTESSLRSM